MLACESFLRFDLVETKIGRKSVGHMRLYRRGASALSPFFS